MTMLLKLFFYIMVLLIAILGYRSYSNNSSSLQIDQRAPDFTLKDADNNTHALSDYKGRFLVLYFYPKDDTPGCTKEACNFRDRTDELKKLGAAVVGISIDSPESHRKFADKYQLPFTLLADSNGEVARRYGALSNFIIAKIAKRHTFIIGPDSKIKKIYTHMDVSNHSQQIIDDLQTIQQRQQSTT